MHFVSVHRFSLPQTSVKTFSASSFVRFYLFLRVDQLFVTFRIEGGAVDLSDATKNSFGMIEMTFGNQPARTLRKNAEETKIDEESSFLDVQVKEEKRNGENGQSDVQPTPRSNQIGEEEKNQFAEGKEILDDDAGEQTLFRSDWKRKRSSNGDASSLDSPISAPKRKKKIELAIRPALTDDETRQGDAARRTGEKKSSQNEESVINFETEFSVRREGAHERGHGEQNEGSAHDRPPAELVRENAEDQRTDHVAEEENRLNETFQLDAIANHRPLRNEMNSNSRSRPSFLPHRPESIGNTNAERRSAYRPAAARPRPNSFENNFDILSAKDLFGTFDIARRSVGKCGEVQRARRISPWSFRREIDNESSAWRR